MSSYYTKTDINNKYPFRLGKDSSGNYGYYKDGADTVTPFKSQTDINNAYNKGKEEAKQQSISMFSMIDAIYGSGTSSPNTSDGSSGALTYSRLIISFKEVPSKVIINNTYTFSSAELTSKDQNKNLVISHNYGFVTYDYGRRSSWTNDSNVNAFGIYRELLKNKGFKSPSNSAIAGFTQNGYYYNRYLSTEDSTTITYPSEGTFTYEIHFSNNQTITIIISDVIMPDIRDDYCKQALSIKSLY